MSRASTAYRAALAMLMTAVPTLCVAVPQAAAESSTRPAAGPEAPDEDWTLLADLALASPVVLRGTVARTRKLFGRAAEGVPPGTVRLLLEVDLANVLKAPGLLPARAEWLWQGPVGADGKPPWARGDDVLAFLSAAQPGPKPEVAQFRLIAPAAMRAWTPAEDAAVRAVLAEALGGGALMVTGVRDAFRTEGSVAGNSESQIFLATDAGKPLTLVVTRRPEAQPTVRVATGDLIATSASPIVARTLVWRALACGLPRALPDPMAADAGLVADYELVRDRLGDCGRRAFPDGARISGSTG